MSLSEIDHPIAPEIVDICEAIEGGMQGHWNFPDHIKVAYTSPLEEPDGCTIIHIADWQTENMTSLVVPVFATDDKGPLVYYGEEAKLTGARLVVKDVLQRSFRLNTNEGAIGVPYSQFDIVPEGVVLSTEHNGLAIVQMGLYDEATYGVFVDAMRAQASIALLHEVATEFLGK